ncbi:MAG: hypothetical protein AAF525_09655, partial [Pseudomonadota bacterium]
IWDDLSEEATLAINDRQLRFFDQFEKVVKRTGTHVQTGHVFAKELKFPEELYNHEVYDVISSHFGCKA